jgi:hypothetical protein
MAAVHDCPWSAAAILPASRRTMAVSIQPTKAKRASVTALANIGGSFRFGAEQFGNPFVPKTPAFRYPWPDVPQMFHRCQAVCSRFVLFGEYWGG